MTVSFIMMLSFVSDLVLHKDTCLIFTALQPLKLVRQILTVGWASFHNVMHFTQYPDTQFYSNAGLYMQL